MEKRFPERQEILYALYSAYSDSGNDKKMVETLDKIESIVGRNEQLTMEKSNAYLRSGDKKKALAEMEGLVAEYPQDSRYKVLLGSLYEQIDESDEAYSIYQGVLSAEPDNALALMAMLGYYEKNGSAELYEKQLNDVLSSKTVDAEGKRSILLNRVAYIENSKQDSTKAIALFDRTIESENYDTETLQLYAQYLWEKKMQKESQPLLEKVLQAEPDNKMARLMLLQLAVNGEDYALVESVCKAGVDELPDVLEFYLYLALAYNHDGRTDDALSAINLGIEHVDGKTDKALASDLYSMQGDLYHTKNMPVEAYSAYDTALSYNSESVAVLNNYAYYLSVDNRDLDKAEEMSYKTIKAEPNNSTYLDTYAWILFMKGRYTEARTYIDQALKNIDDASGVVKEHCGDIYYMNGDVDEAVKYWKQSLDEGNDSKTLKEKIKRKRYIAE
jgi:predicted Zn-dependent protease